MPRRRAQDREPVPVTGLLDDIEKDPRGSRRRSRRGEDGDLDLDKIW